MVRKFLLLCLVFILSISIYAQVPDAFKYQAVIQNSSGEILQNQDVSIQISILDGSAIGTNVFTETHSVTTSNSGLINLNIGKGTVESGDFSTINWASGDKYLKVEIDETGGSTYTELGVVQLLSIPYALYANEVANKDDADANPTNEIQDIDLSGTNLSITGGSTVDLSVLQDGIDDADADSTNEIQDLNLTSNVLTITNHPSPTEIDLAPFQGTNTDEQVLSLDGTDLSISGGNTLDVSSLQDGVDDADNNPNNELQTLTIDGDTLILSNGNEVILPYDSSNWVISGDQMYYNGGNVGIGSSAPVSNLEVKANIAGSDALFQVINANNDTVFAVYPDGVKIFIDPTAKGKVGGFAVSGRSPSKAGGVDILRVTIDSTRIYVSDTVSAKGKVGGFAVSGRSPSKGITNDYLVITGDSTRIYINDTSTVKGKVGGFAVSGRSPSKGITNDYLQVTRDSTRIYVTESTTKGKVGGFAVSGRSPSKGTEKDYFNISGNLTAQTIDPSEARIFWYPKKEAFLTGRVLVESPDSVGTNSMATGFESKSIGDYSQALGYKARAKGNSSTAIGNNANAVGNESYAFGNFAAAQDSGSYAIGSGATATGLRSFALGSTGVDSAGIATSPTMAIADYAYAFGMGSVASGQGAFALGTQNISSGDYSLAMGYNNLVSNKYSTAIGLYTLASGYKSIAIGFSAEASGNRAFAIGTSNLASGNYSIALGYKTNASFVGTTAMGYEAEATNYFATSIGYQTIANGENSLSLGSKTEAYGFYSTSIGYGAWSSGDASMSLGTYTMAEGYSATALGFSTTASGDYSTSCGNMTEASGDYSTAMGNWSYATASYAVAMGDGSTASGQASTAMGQDTKASGTSSTAMGNRTTASGDYTTAMGYRASTNSFKGSFIYGDNSTTSYINATAADQFMVRASGGTIFYSNSALSSGVTLSAGGGAWASVSDKHKKENFKDINSAEVLEKLSKINIQSWNYKSQDSAIKHVGITAQDFYQNFGFGENDTTLIWMDVAGINSIAIQELIKENNDKQNQIDELTKMVNELKDVVNEMKDK